MLGQEGPLWMRKLLSKMAGTRLKKGNYGFPLEQKLYDMYVKATGQAQKKQGVSEDYQQLQPETDAQLADKSVSQKAKAKSRASSQGRYGV